MGWLWENYDPDAFYSIAAKPQCPAMETGWERDADINILPRLYEVFSALIHSDIDASVKSEISNILLHYLARQDFSRGSDLHGLSMRRLDGEIRAGSWGRDVCDLYKKLSASERNRLLRILQSQELRGRLLPEAAIQEFFPGSEAFLREHEILICLRSEETGSNKDLWQLLNALCLPFGLPYRLFWNMEPCILDRARLGRAFLV